MVVYYLKWEVDIVYRRTDRGFFFARVKRPRREVDHSPPSIAEVNTEWSYTSAPPIRLCGLEMGDFIFTFTCNSLRIDPIAMLMHTDTDQFLPVLPGQCGCSVTVVQLHQDG
jgi:hypothetical protein